MSIISMQSQVKKAIVVGEMQKIAYLKKKTDGSHFDFFL